jgi:hypothetical protein
MSKGSELVTTSSNYQAHIATLRHLHFGLTTRLRDFARTLGITFKGERDIRSACGYVKAPTLKHYRDLYEIGGIAKRLVEWGPKKVWINGYSVVDDEDPKKNTPFEEACESLYKSLRLPKVLLSADILAALADYSVVYLGFDDVKTVSDMSQPVKPGAQLVQVRPVHQDSAAIGTYIDNLATPLMGLPNEYQITFANSVGSANSKLAKVHFHRVLHFTRGTLDDPVRGQPLLRAVYDLFTDLLKLSGGGAEAFWRSMAAIRHFDLDPLAKITPEQREEMKEEMDAVVHGIKSVLKTQGVKSSQLAPSTSDYSNPAETTLRFIAGTVGVPWRELVGAEQGQLASAQDRENSKDRAKENRQIYAEDNLRSLYDRLIEFGSIPEPKSGEYEIDWAEPLGHSLTERSTVITNLAKANRDNAKAGAGIILTGNEIRDSLLEKDEPIAEGEPDGKGESSDKDETDPQPPEVDTESEDD